MKIERKLHRITSRFSCRGWRSLKMLSAIQLRRSWSTSHGANTKNRKQMMMRRKLRPELLQWSTLSSITRPLPPTALIEEAHHHPLAVGRGIRLGARFPSRDPLIVTVMRKTLHLKRMETLAPTTAVTSSSPIKRSRPQTQAKTNAVLTSRAKINLRETCLPSPRTART